MRTLEQIQEDVCVNLCIRLPDSQVKYVTTHLYDSEQRQIASITEYSIVYKNRWYTWSYMFDDDMQMYNNLVVPGAYEKWLVKFCNELAIAIKIKNLAQTHPDEVKDTQ